MEIETILLRDFGGFDVIEIDFKMTVHQYDLRYATACTSSATFEILKVVEVSQYSCFTNN
jgi:hypothetical protein